MKAIENIPEIIAARPVDRKEIDRILGQSDLLVCPSREDLMLTVAAGGDDARYAMSDFRYDRYSGIHKK